MESFSICKFCLKEQANYKCPRCNLEYCSLVCYKEPGHRRCSEDFYKNEVLNEIRNDNTVESAKSLEKLINELSFVDKSTMEDNRSEMGAETGIIDLDSGVPIYDQLSLKDKELFSELLNTGKASLFLPKLEVWWRSSEENLICSASVEVTSFDCLYSGKPSDCIPFHCCNIVFVYCVAYRIFCGDFFDLPDEVCNLINSCCVLCNPSIKFSSVSEAIWGTILRMENHHLDYLKMVSKSQILLDIRTIVSSSEFRQYVFSDLYSVCQRLKNVFGSKKCKKLLLSIKFFLSWMKSVHCGAKTWKTVTLELDSIAKDIQDLDNCKLPDEITQEIRKHVQRVPKVEAIN